MKKMMKTLLIGCISSLLVFGFASCQKNCEHVYDNACDVTCNECGEARTVAHDWKEADCTTPKTCKVCGTTEGSALGHTPNADDNDCTTAVTCSKCGTVTTEAKDAHTPNADDGNCLTAVTCSICGTVTTEAKEAHTPNADDGNCLTAVTCSICGTVTTEAKDAHTPNADDGDCTTAITCSICGTVTTEAKEAHTPNADDGDCTTAVTCSICGTVTTEAKEAHTPNADDNDCTTPVTCTECDYIFVEAISHNFASGDTWNAIDTQHWHRCLNEGCEAKDSLGNHTLEDDDGDCTTAVLCDACGWAVIAANENHTPNDDDGDCTTAITCSECETVITEAKESHTGADDGDCTTSVLCSECNTIIIAAKEKHEDKNLNGVCDYCDFELDYVYDEDKNAYVIFTVQGLYAWAEDSWKGLNLTLGKDIKMPTEMQFDLDEDGINDSNWDPQSASSVIDGNGYSITGLVIKSTKDLSGGGFINSLSSSGIVKNLRLLDVDMQFVGINYAILVGYNDGKIENCGVSGNLYVEGNNVAGIAGTNSGIIIACYNDANITATNGGVGGIVGQNVDGNDVIACYNTGNITSNASSVGGIIGSFYGGNIIACYSTGALSGTSEVGLVIGYCDGTYLANYASVSSNNSEITKSNGCTVVDGETVTWSNAKEAMNNTLEAAEINWRYVENTGTDPAIHPLIFGEAS